jgi:N6-L-threonylcarbamoyladenine synthase
MTILAIETSCDDTAVAVVRSGAVLSSIVSSQPIHNAYGGIVPELASREHIKAMAPLTTVALAQAGCAMNDIDAIAVTTGPGLAGSLVVGLNFAKGLALAHSVPLIPVHHIEAHLYSPFLEHPDVPFPSIGLLVSGGHTAIVVLEDVQSYRIVGTTRDDAAGEAFDKVAKMLGLGYPGGPHIDRLASTGNATAIHFPRGMSGQETLDMSFSGLKTAVRTYLHHGAQHAIEDICASVQAAIVDVLIDRTLRAAERYRAASVTVSGGVSANSELRRRLTEECQRRGIRIAIPSLQYSIDNAAMIGFLAEVRCPTEQTLSSNWRTVTVHPNPIR